MLLSFGCLHVSAQFHTIQSVGPDADTLFISTDPYVRDVISGMKEKESPEKKSLLQLLAKKVLRKMKVQCKFSLKKRF